ncbi:hypothetical protein RB195_025330 [Necator americanus]|uniref:Prokaryotic-type class I peptide chain release factors domain-containing protein n=1 Tax=Necator americanus TaxID=51031 RepID=A0ABR1ERT4_NECAM
MGRLQASSPATPNRLLCTSQSPDCGFWPDRRAGYRDVMTRDALVLHKHQWLRLRPLTKSPSCVQEKAKEIQAQLRPARVRPKTNAVVARRMVEHTLGLRSSISKEQRDAERKQLSDARTAKKSTVRWDD